MASAREHVQGEKRSGRGLDGFSVLMVSERRISPQRRGWPESAGKNRESYGSMQSTVLSAAEKSKPGKQQQQHIVLSDLVVIAAGFNMMTREIARREELRCGLEVSK